VKREYDVSIDNLKNDLGQYDILKSKISVMDFKMAREIQKVTDKSRAALDNVLRSKQTVENQLNDRNTLIHQLKQEIELLNSEVKRLEKEKQVALEKQTNTNDLKALTHEFEEYERKTKDLILTKDVQLADLLALRKKCMANQLFLFKQFLTFSSPHNNIYY
jgi:predicted  nucleic acid-binding Zn-ribbon protein